MAKKGQLTIFIIIGILLLVAVGIVLYVQRAQIISPIEAGVPQVTKVPATVQPLQDFIQDCLKITARQGLDILGGRGGYIDPKQRFNPVEPTDGAAVQFSPNAKLKVPYWWYMKSPNRCEGTSCEFDSERPCLTRADEQDPNQRCKSPSIAHQLDTYLATELPKCFRGFEQFAAQNFIITPQGEMKPETRINRNDVVVLLTYPLEARRGDETFELKDFVTQLQVNLYEIYQLSTDITNLEANSTFLEHATRSLIDIFGRADEDALPPVTEMEFGFGTSTIWTKIDVIEKIQQMLASYIPLLKVMNTRNYRYFPAPTGKDRQFYEVMYNRGFTVPNLQSHGSLNVKFVSLPWWKPYVNLNCNGQLCQAEGFGTTLLGIPFGMRRYNFAYDVSYPVLVDVSNPDAYGGEGYSFRFFLEENMRNNEPSATMENPLTVANLTEHNSLLCDPSQRTGGNATITVRTSAGQPVDEAEVLYRCGAETCDIGTSVDGKVFAPLPRCIGGFITATHQDYAGAVKPLDVLDASPKAADLTLGVGYPVDFSVKKWALRKSASAWNLDTQLSEHQGPRENSIIMLQRTGEPFEEPITVIGEVCGSPFYKAAIPCGTPPSDSSKDVRVYAGNYHVTIYTFQYPSPALQIPPDRRCISRGPFKKKKCFFIPTKPIIFNTERPLMSGVAEYDWTVSEDDLKKAKNIEFYVISFGLDKVLPASARKIEDLEVMGSMFTYSAQYPSLLEPVIT